MNICISPCDISVGQYTLKSVANDFKICLLKYKCLHQLTPVYLTSLLTLVMASAVCLATPRKRTVGFGS